MLKKFKKTSLEEKKELIKCGEDICKKATLHIVVRNGLVELNEKPHD